MDAELSQAAKDLLTAAAKAGGKIWLLKADQGKWVRIGDRNFQDNHDPTVAATYCEALEGLRKRGYTTHEGDNLYILTDLGAKKAAALNR